MNTIFVLPFVWKDGNVVWDSVLDYKINDIVACSVILKFGPDKKQAFSRIISWYFFRYERKLILSEKNDVGGTTAYKHG